MYDIFLIRISFIFIYEHLLNLIDVIRSPLHKEAEPAVKAPVKT